MNTNNLSPQVYSGFNLRSGNSSSLNNKIENLKSQELNSNLSSNTNELNQIINSKLVNFDSNQTESLNLKSKSNSLNLPQLLALGSKSSDLIKAVKENQINSKGKYVALGNKHMSLSLFKSNLIYFNKGNSLNKIRHYLNLLTNFEIKLFNSNYNYYSFNKTNKYLFAMQKASKFLKIAFYSKGCLISKPSFNLVYTNYKIEEEINKTLQSNLNQKAAKVVISLFYYVKTTELQANSLSNTSTNILTENFESKFSFLTDYLTKLFNTEVELNLVRLYQPYQDSNILVQFLNSESYNNKFIRLVSKLFQNINIYKKDTLNVSSSQSINNVASYPSGVSGVNIKLAGRPLNERIIPRLTVKRAQRGSFNRLNAKLIEKSMFTDKTRKGAFSFTVTLSQVFR